MPQGETHRVGQGRNPLSSTRSVTETQERGAPAPRQGSPYRLGKDERVLESTLANRANLLGSWDLRVNVIHLRGLMKNLFQLRNSG